MKMKESYNLEFKEEISRTFLKTVSAYANYNDGEILFGIDDDGQLLGMKNLATEESLRIENMINDSLVPVPNFEISVEDNGVGFTKNNAVDSYGLNNMEERSRNIGMFFTIENLKGNGTKITVTDSPK